MVSRSAMERDLKETKMAILSLPLDRPYAFTATHISGCASRPRGVAEGSSVLGRAVTVEPFGRK